MNGQMVYTYQSISPILFKQNVMGVQTPIKIAGFKGYIDLPSLDNTKVGEFSKVLPPNNFSTGVLNWDKGNLDIEWGRQVAMPGGETIVGNYLLEFSISKTKFLAMKHMEEIELGLDEWFSLLREWIEVITEQDLSIDEPLGGTQDIGNYLWSWQSKKRWRMATSATFHMTASIQDVSKAITRDQWEKAVNKANKGIRPPDEHLILRDARARIYRKQYKYAAIFLGVAVELTLKKKLEEKMIKRGKSRRLINDILNNTLGKIFDICESFDIDLPDEARYINTLRNDAVHKDKTISRENTLKALVISTELINRNSVF